MKLFIDTSSEYIILALLNDQKIIEYYHENCLKKHSEVSLDKIKEFLLKNHIKNSDINEIYCVVGPGSFTGIRVTLTIVKAWYLVYPISIYYGTSFDIQHHDIKYISANNNEVYDHSYNLIPKTNIDVKKIGYINHKDISNNLFNNLKKFKKIHELKELSPVYAKGFI